jgi:ATP-dependent DNA ligase
MQPTNLKAIARDATVRGDTKALFHALDLLERVVPIATFMDFCTELDVLRGAPTAALIRGNGGR